MLVEIYGQMVEVTICPPGPAPDDCSPETLSLPVGAVPLPPFSNGDFGFEGCERGDKGCGRAAPKHPSAQTKVTLCGGTGSTAEKKSIPEDRVEAIEKIEKAMETLEWIMTECKYGRSPFLTRWSPGCVSQFADALESALEWLE